MSIMPPRISLLMFMCRLAFMPMYRPTTLNNVEQMPMMHEACRTASVATFCRQAKEMPTAKASMLVAIDNVIIFNVLNVFIFSLSSLQPSHIIFIPK